MQSLIDAILDGDQALSLDETRALLEDGIERDRIVIEAIEVAMTQLDRKCTVEQFNLLEIMLAGRAASGVMKYLYPAGASTPARKGVVVIGSLEGDVHDLGKNIVKMVLSTKGFRVVDCGRDCPLERLIDSAEQEDAFAVCISGLITTVIPAVQKAREVLGERGLGQVRVIAGGAALKQSDAETLNVDFVAENVFEGASYMDAIYEGAK